MMTEGEASKISFSFCTACSKVRQERSLSRHFSRYSACRPAQIPSGFATLKAFDEAVLLAVAEEVAMFSEGLPNKNSLEATTNEDCEALVKDFFGDSPSFGIRLPECVLFTLGKAIESSKQNVLLEKKGRLKEK